MKKQRTYEFLNKLNIPFESIEHSEANTMEACEQISKDLGVNIAKNLFLCNRQKTVFYLLLMPGDKPFKTKELSHQLNISRLSFAEEEYMEKFLGVTPGSVSILGLMNDTENNVNLIIDRDLLNDQFIGCHPLINTASLKIKTNDILNVFLPAVNHTYTLVTLGETTNEE